MVCTNVLRWSLVFTPSNLEHFAERNIDADDVAEPFLAATARPGSGAAVEENTLAGSLWPLWLVEN